MLQIEDSKLGAIICCCDSDSGILRDSKPLLIVFLGHQYSTITKDIIGMVDFAVSIFQSLEYGSLMFMVDMAERQKL